MDEARQVGVVAKVYEEVVVLDHPVLDDAIHEHQRGAAEVIEPEEKLETHRINKPNYAAVWKEPAKEVEPPKPILSNWQRAELLDNFHREHGNFEDVHEYVQNEEQGDTTTWKKIKNKTTTEEDYHQRMEQRIEDLMTKVDAGEIKLEDLTAEDRQVIMDIRNQNEI